MKVLFTLLVCLIVGISNAHSFSFFGKSKGEIREEEILKQVTGQWKFKYEIAAVSSSVRYQRMIDRAYRKIFSTKAAELVCNIFPEDDIKVIRNLLGTSLSESRAINDICSRYPKNSNLAPYIPDPVKLFLVFPEEGKKFPLFGWSNKYGHTFLFLSNRQNIEEKELVEAWHMR